MFRLKPARIICTTVPQRTKRGRHNSDEFCKILSNRGTKFNANFPNQLTDFRAILYLAISDLDSTSLNYLERRCTYSAQIPLTAYVEKIFVPLSMGSFDVSVDTATDCGLDCKVSIVDKDNISNVFI
jgi:hypothetical protein